MPIEIKTTTYIEYINSQKNYTEEELKNKIEKELEQQMEEEYQVSKYEEKNKKRNIYVDVDNEGITVKIIYEIQKEIGTKITNE